MHPEELDLLLRTGEVTTQSLYNPQDYSKIAELCLEEYAVNLYSHTAQRHRLLTGRDRATCYGEGMAKIHLTHSNAVLNKFIDRRLTLGEEGVDCSQVVLKNLRGEWSPTPGSTSDLPDPVLDDFTVVPWTDGLTHCQNFPHMVLLVRDEMPHVYTVIPLDASFLNREDIAFEAVRIFSIYSHMNVCLCFAPDRCVYIRKDGTYRRSCRRPSGGVVAHRSVTGPHLYKLHIEVLKALAEDQPGSLQWYDEFDGNAELYTAREYNQVEAVTELSSEILALVNQEITCVLDEYVPRLGKVWESDTDGLREDAAAWVRALDIEGNVRVVGKEDLPRMASCPLTASEFLPSPLFTTIEGALDVMAYDLKRAGLYEIVNTRLQPVYSASHYGYMSFLGQTTRLAGPPDNETFWNRIHGQVLPSAVCSPVTLLRLLVWQRIAKHYREFVAPVDTDRCSFAQAQNVLAALPLLLKVNERGPRWIWQCSQEICVSPAVIVHFDEDGEPHCEDGPAIIDPDGSEQTLIHGKDQSE